MQNDVNYSCLCYQSFQVYALLSPEPFATLTNILFIYYNVCTLISKLKAWCNFVSVLYEILLNVFLMTFFQHPVWF